MAAHLKICMAHSKISMAYSTVLMARLKILTARSKILTARLKILTARSKICTARLKICTAHLKICTARSKICTAHSNFGKSSVPPKNKELPLFCRNVPHCVLLIQVALSHRINNAWYVLSVTLPKFKTLAMLGFSNIKGVFKNIFLFSEICFYL